MLLITHFTPRLLHQSTLYFDLATYDQNLSETILNVFQAWTGPAGCIVTLRAVYPAEWKVQEIQANMALGDTRMDVTPN